VRHTALLIPALARLSSYPHLFPDAATAHTFWNITRLHIISIRLTISAYHRITGAWRAFSESDDAAQAAAHATIYPLQRTPQGHVVPPWKTWLSARPMSFGVPLQGKEPQKDILVLSRAWDDRCDRMAEMRREGYVPLIVQIIPQQGVLIAEAWRLAMQETVEAVASMSLDPDVVEALLVRAFPELSCYFGLLRLSTTSFLMLFDY
jgi:hypothetical protein